MALGYSIWTVVSLRSNQRAVLGLAWALLEPQAPLDGCAADVGSFVLGGSSSSSARGASSATLRRVFPASFHAAGSTKAELKPTDAVGEHQKGQMAVEDLDLLKARYEASQMHDVHATEDTAKTEISEARMNAGKNLMRGQVGATEAAEMRAEEAVYRQFGPTPQGNEAIHEKEHATKVEKESSAGLVKSDERKDENKVTLNNEWSEEEELLQAEALTKAAIKHKIYERNKVPGKLGINKWGERITSKAACAAEFNSNWNEGSCIVKGEEVGPESAEEIVAAERVEEYKVLYEVSLEQHAISPDDPATKKALKDVGTTLLGYLEDLVRFQTRAVQHDLENAKLIRRNKGKLDELAHVEAAEKAGEATMMGSVMQRLMNVNKDSVAEASTERVEAHIAADEASAISEGHEDVATYMKVDRRNEEKLEMDEHDLKMREEAATGGKFGASKEYKELREEADEEDQKYDQIEDKENRVVAKSDEEVEELAQVNLHKLGKQKEALSTQRLIEEIRGKMAELEHASVSEPLLLLASLMDCRSRLQAVQRASPAVGCRGSPGGARMSVRRRARAFECFL